MKVLFWIALILFVCWAWRRSRSSAARQTPPASPPQTQDMVDCAHCGVHLPRNEAVTGTRGPYCSTAHRSAAGDRNPD